MNMKIFKVFFLINLGLFLVSGYANSSHVYYSAETSSTECQDYDENQIVTDSVNLIFSSIKTKKYASSDYPQYKLIQPENIFNPPRTLI